MSLNLNTHPSGTDYTGMQCESGYNDTAIGSSTGKLVCKSDGDMDGAPNCTGKK